MRAIALAALRKLIKSNATNASIFVDTGNERMAIIHARGVAYLDRVRLGKIEPSAVDGLMTITFDGQIAKASQPNQFPYKIAREAMKILDNLASGKTLF
jgi:hypothetical protein